MALILNVRCLDDFISAGKYIIDTRPEPTPIEHYKILAWHGTGRNEQMQ